MFDLKYSHACGLGCILFSWVVQIHPKIKSMVLRLFCKLFVNPIDKVGGQEYIFGSRADRVLKIKRTAPQEVRKTMKKNIDTANARLCRRRARSC